MFYEMEITHGNHKLKLHIYEWMSKRKGKNVVNTVDDAQLLVQYSINTQSSLCRTGKYFWGRDKCRQKCHLMHFSS